MMVASSPSLTMLSSVALGSGGIAWLWIAMRMRTERPHFAASVGHSLHRISRRLRPSGRRVASKSDFAIAGWIDAIAMAPRFA
jgi:hypothetical protein